LNPSSTNHDRTSEIQFSVIMSVRNGAETIKEALASVANQTFPALEIIVADDGSTDESVVAAESAFSEYGLTGKVLRLDGPVGAGKARNEAVLESIGNTVAILDSDDCWDRGHLQNAANEFIQHPNAVGYCSRVEIRDESKWELPGRVFPEDPGYRPPGALSIYEQLLKGLNVWNVTLCLKKKVYLKAKGFEESLRCYEDHWLFLNSAREGDFFLSNQVGCIVRNRSASLSSSKQKSGRLTMSNAMYEDRIILIGLMKGDERFKAKDIRTARSKAASFIATEFRDMCRARQFGQTAQLTSAISRGFFRQPVFVVRILLKSVWETFCLGITLLSRKVLMKMGYSQK
jgi:glycosyltransferase involved in cell wall biosynthesis